ncbi:calcium channel [Ectocarpus siliculosus]|uniref:Calcium channel n=1 Tax=Ectocarpus siliculosus TaxID=2880 RepID=D7FNV4_ECTSI|nr:calcium channel [Ectocarpus siliculosus]|eukprot:CBJ30230.1 calcium channel [Ectocarpus siliculosus]
MLQGCPMETSLSRHILGAVAEIWVLILFNIGLFAWVGVILFSGTEEGGKQFSDLCEASWRLFVLFTTTNFPTIMMTALDQVRATIIFFAFFVILNVFFLAPLSLAFIFNVFRGGQSGIPQMEEEIRLRSTAAAFTLLDDRQSGQVLSANMGAFLLELHSMRGVASRELSRLQGLIDEVGARTPEEAPSLTLQDFQDAVDVLDRSREHAEWITEIQWYYPQLYQSPGFRRLTRIVKHKRVTFWPGCCGTPQFSMLLIDAVDTFLLVMSFAALWLAKSFSASEHDSERYDWVQITIVASFCVTVGLRAAVRGWYNCLQRPTWAFSALVTFFSVVVLVLVFLVPAEQWGWRLLRALRVTHMALAMAFLPRMAFLIRTLLTMTKRAATPASVLLAWSFFMAVLGAQIFGGKVCVPELAENDESCLGTTVVSNTYTDTGLMLLNFNDVPTSFVTLLVLFVVNDWT